MAELPIVERLRSEYLIEETQGCRVTRIKNPDGEEAADLIEKLYEALEELDDMTIPYTDAGPSAEGWESDKLKACRERVKAALALAKGEKQP